MVQERARSVESQLTKEINALVEVVEKLGPTGISPFKLSEKDSLWLGSLQGSEVLVRSIYREAGQEMVWLTLAKGDDRTDVVITKPDVGEPSIEIAYRARVKFAGEEREKIESPTSELSNFQMATLLKLIRENSSQSEQAS